MEVSILINIDCSEEGRLRKMSSILVAVDSKGDVLQWGLGFGTPSSSNVKDSGASPTVSVAEPHPTLVSWSYFHIVSLKC